MYSVTVNVDVNLVLGYDRIYCHGVTDPVFSAFYLVYYGVAACTEITVHVNLIAVIVIYCNFYLAEDTGCCVRNELLTVYELDSFSANGDLVVCNRYVVCESKIFGRAAYPCIVFSIGKRENCVVGANVSAAVIRNCIELCSLNSGEVCITCVYGVFGCGNSNKCFLDSEGNNCGLITESELCGVVARGVGSTRDSYAVLLVYNVSIRETEDVIRNCSLCCLAVVNESSGRSGEGYRTCKSTVSTCSCDFASVKRVNIRFGMLNSLLHSVTAAVDDVVKILIFYSKVCIVGLVVVGVEIAV